MIPAFMIRRFGPDVARVMLIAAAVVLGLVLLTIVQCSNSSGYKTQAKIDKGQTAAAQGSGKDAVETVATAMNNETATDAVTRENTDAIDQAAGTRERVSDDARRAGLRALCRRPSFARDNPGCVQLVRP